MDACGSQLVRVVVYALFLLLYHHNGVSHLVCTVFANYIRSKTHSEKISVRALVFVFG
jgi:bacterioferritin (cytochrome b1)